MKNKLFILFFFIISIALGILYIENKTMREELNYSISNIKAYDLENSHLKNANLTFQFTVDQLNYMQDSLVKEMNKVRKELGIKDKDIKRLEYINSTMTRVDTIFIKDTIFKEPTFKVDTTYKDENNWYTLNLKLQYPNVIIAKPTVKSKVHIITSYKKETINPPKKCFIARWFQRKHKVLEVDIVEENPNIITENSKFIEIIK